MSNLVITIGRQCGSRGKTIGKKVAEALGVKCYDKELLTEAAKHSGLCEELFETHDEKPTNSFLYSLVMDTYSLGYTTSAYMDMPINHKIFLAQFDTIKKLADQESCVIVGRCADFILRDRTDCLNVFIHAAMDKKVERIVKLYGETADKPEKRLQDKDKKRRVNYRYYTDREWGASQNYHLCLDSGEFGIEKCAQIIVDLAK